MNLTMPIRTQINQMPAWQMGKVSDQVSTGTAINRRERPPPPQVIDTVKTSKGASKAGQPPESDMSAPPRKHVVGYVPGRGMTLKASDAWKASQSTGERGCHSPLGTVATTPP